MHLNQSPLPFIGQKRMFLRKFIEILNENIPDDGEGWTIVDVFGGSGLLSHVAKKIKPKANVIYNDYDDFQTRLKNISDTNLLRNKIAEILKDINRDEPLSPDKKAQVIKAIEDFQGFKDYITISSWLFYSGRCVDSFEKLIVPKLFNHIRKTDYLEADDYLSGLVIVKKDFKDLLVKYQNKEKTLFILDPPYLTTYCDTYKSKNYFDLVDFLELIHLVRPPFIFFSSTKSEIHRFLEFAKRTKSNNYYAFENAIYESKNCILNSNREYHDNIFYRFD